MPGTQFPATFSLANLNGLNGFKLDGETAGDQSGSTTSLGDVNGDGFADVLVGAQAYSSYTGRTYVVFGGNQPVPGGLLSLSSLNGTNGYKLQGEISNSHSGNAISVGNVNGDLYGDLVIDAFCYTWNGVNCGPGRSYVVYGSNTTVSGGLFLLSSLNGTNGYKLNGENVADGSSAKSVGDVNGDGYGDVLVGANGYASNIGRTYVIYGSNQTIAGGSLALSSSNIYKLNGENSLDYSGSAISAAGDFNKDGYHDVLIGAYGHTGGNPNAVGRSYLVYGSNNTSGGLLALSSLNGANGFKLDGEATGDFCSWSVNLAGDVNGDSYDDLLIGAVRHTSSVGRTYVVYGNNMTVAGGLLALSSLNGMNGFKLDGEAGGDSSAYSVSAAGDVNNDGYGDLLIGAPGHNGVFPNSVGRSYVVFGGPSVGASGIITLANLNGTNGFKIDGETSGDQNGLAVSGGADINGDSLADIVVGSPYYNGGAGRTYVIFGDTSPQLWTNQLTITNGQTATLTNQNLNATDNAPVVYSVSGVTQGYFQLTTRKGQAVTTFTQAQLSAGQVQFVHNGGGMAPTYSIQNPNTGIALTPAAQAANITFIPKTLPVTQFPATFSLANLNGLNGFKIDGEATGDLSGCGVSTAGDVNGDGHTDLLIGAFGHASNTGRSYVVFGGIGVGGSGLLNLSSLNGTNGFKLDGETTGDNSGAAVSAVGDMNGDSWADLLIGAWGYASNQGRSYLVFGGPGIGNSSILSLSALSGTNGVKLDGDANSVSGAIVGSAEDINGDGRPDLMVGAHGYASSSGRTYVLFGAMGLGSGGVISLSNSNGTNGFKMNGEGSLDDSGHFVSSAGDINADGHTDLLTSAAYWNGGYPNGVGRTYAVFGGPGVGAGGTLALGSVNGVNGFKVNGEASGDLSGASVGSLGDINADGLSDILIGAFGHSSNTGRSYVVFGVSGIGNSGLLTLSSLNGINGFKIDGEVAGDNSGITVSPAGDFNGDGQMDLLIGAPGHNGNLGRSYVVLGAQGIGSGGSLSLANLNGTNGFKLDGELAGDISGNFVSSAGDVNGDGLSDIIIAAPSRNSGTGRTYVVFGDVAPQIFNNQLTVPDGKTVTLSNQNLNATDNTPVNFNITSITQGYFQLSSNPGHAVTTFSQAQVTAGQVQFVHSNSGIAPAFSVQTLNTGIALTPPAQAANIVFYHKPVTVANQLVINQGQSLYFNASSLNINDAFPAAQVNFTISNLQHGQFQLMPANTTVSQFTGAQLQANQIVFVQDGGAIAPSYQVAVMDPYFSLSPSSASVTFYRQPALTASPFPLHQGDSMVFAPSLLSLTSEDYLPAQVNFAVTNLQHGQFQLLPGNATVSQFTWSQLQANQVLFVQDSSASAPSYQLTASDPYFTTAAVNNNITFYRRPVLTNNPIAINQGQSVVVSTSDLNVLDDYPANQVNFTVSNLQHGQWLLLPANTSVTQFTLAQLQVGNLMLTADGSATPPSYQIGVSDPYFTLAPVAGSVAFYHQPSWVNNALTVNQGQALIMGTASISVQDDYPANQFLFNVMNIQNGHFTLMSANNTVTQFSNLQLQSGLVLFVHDGSTQAPSYQLSGQDPYFSLSGTAAAVTFYRQPVVSRNVLTINQGQSVTITPQIFNMTDDYPANQVNVTISGLQHGQFILLPSNASVTQFTLADLQASRVGFVQDGIATVPAYQLSVRDPYFTLAPVSSTVTFYRQPVLTQNPLVIHQGNTIPFIPSVLNITDDYPPGQVNTTISNLQNAQFQLLPLNTSITQFTQTQWAAGLVQLVQDGSTNAPSYQLALSDPYFTLAAASPSMTFYRLAAVAHNQLTINQGQNLFLTPSFLNVVSDYPTNQVFISVTALQFGQFEVAPSDNVVSTFTAQQLQAGQILFAQDGSAGVPTYRITVADPYSTSPASTVNVTFYRKPVLSNNAIAINQGQTLLLGVNSFGVTDDYPISQVFYTFTNLQHAQFTLTTANTTVTQFTAAQLAAGNILLAQDGTNTAPSYQISISDTYFSLPSVSGAVTFYRQPTLTDNFVALNRGQSVTLTPSIFPIVDDYPAGQVFLNITQLQHGRFTLLPVNNTISQFSELQLQNNQVVFQQDGSTNAPIFNLTLSDPYFTLLPITVAPVFHQPPELTLAPLTVHQGEQIILDASFLNVTQEAYPANQVTLTVTNLQHAQFQLLPSATIVTQFTQAQAALGDVVLVQDNSANAPSFQLSLADPVFSLPAQSAQITFYHRPVLTNNALVINQGQTRVVDASVLQLQDAYPSGQVNITISGLQHGEFQLPGNVSVTEFTQTQLNSGVVSFVTDGLNLAPSYTVGIADPYFTLTAAAANVTFYRQPAFLNNQLTINQGQAVVLGSSALSVTDDYPAGQVWFNTSNVQFGQFLLLPSDTFITQFSEQQLLAGQVIFAHNGSAHSPSYSLTISDPYFNLPPSAAAITYHAVPPTLVNNQLSTMQNRSTILNLTDFSATDPDPTLNPNNLLFMLSNVQHGYFSLVSAPATAVGQFSQAEVAGGQVEFTQDNSPFAPSVDVAVTDGRLQTAAQACNVYFDAAPTFVNNRLKIDQGQSVVLDITSISATDDDTPTPALVFIASDIQYGYFSSVLKPDVAITHFTQQEIDAASIQFTADNSSNLAPAYNLTVTDRTGLSTGPEPATITFTPTSLPPSAATASTSNAVRNAIIGGAISGGIGFLFFICQLYVKYRSDKALEEGEGTAKEQIEYHKNVIRPISRAILERVKVTGCLDYMSESTARDMSSAVRAVVRALEEEEDVRNFATLSPLRKTHLIDVIARQTRMVVVTPKTGCCSCRLFQSAEATPEQIEQKAELIAMAVKKAMSSNKGVRSETHSTKAQSLSPKKEGEIEMEVLTVEDSKRGSTSQQSEPGADMTVGENPGEGIAAGQTAAALTSASPSALVKNSVLTTSSVTKSEPVTDATESLVI